MEINPLRIPYKERMKIRGELELLIGKRVRLTKMHPDPDPVELGTEGTIILVDDICTAHVDWDNGRKLGLVYGADKYEVLE